MWHWYTWSYLALMLLLHLGRLQPRRVPQRLKTRSWRRNASVPAESSDPSRLEPICWQIFLAKKTPTKKYIWWDDGNDSAEFLGLVTLVNRTLEFELSWWVHGGECGRLNETTLLWTLLLESAISKKNYDKGIVHTRNNSNNNNINTTGSFFFGHIIWNLTTPRSEVHSIYGVLAVISKYTMRSSNMNTERNYKNKSVRWCSMMFLIKKVFFNDFWML